MRKQIPKIPNKMVLVIGMAVMACAPSFKALQADETVQYLKSHYSLMPEQSMTIDRDQKVYAVYTNPTKRYRHGILGDNIEASALVMAMNGQFYEMQLEDHYVFEDLQPRLYDVDRDGQLEMITIRSHIQKGAGIAIYKVVDGSITLFSYVREIGLAQRWLNIVAIDDLDADGIVELVWIQTPHIGGILKVARIYPKRIQSIQALSYYSNHHIGSRNLCLSILRKKQDRKIFFVPTQDRKAIVGFYFKNDRLSKEVSIPLKVDFSQPLSEQYQFPNIIPQSAC